MTIRTEAFLPFIFTVLLLLGSAQAGGQESASTLYRGGEAAEFEEDYYRAIELYKEALLKNPNYLEPMVRMAGAFHILEQDDAALIWVRRAAKLDRENLDLLILEARILSGLGRVVEAREFYEAVLADQPYNMAARIGLAELDLADGRKRHAALQYLETLKAAPDNLHVLLNLALLYESLGEEVTSLAYLEQALSRSSDDPAVFYTAGRYYHQKGDFGTAMEYISTALALKSRYPEATQLMAEILIFQERSGEAVPLLKEVLESQVPAYRYRAYYTLAAAYARIGSIQDALQSYAWAMRLRPDGEAARMAAENLAMSHPDGTEEERRRFADFHYKEGKKLEEKNQLSGALMEYRRALVLDREFHEARLAYANVFRIQGFPYKYLMELLFLRDYYGVSDVAVLDQIEIHLNELKGTVGQRWAARLDPFAEPDEPFDQYAVERESLRIRIYTLQQDNTLIHLFVDTELMRYLEHLLLRCDGLQIEAAPQPVKSFDAAFRDARNRGSQYFFILRFDEEERSFRVSAEAFLTRTGALLDDISVFRTGNGRIKGALSKAAEGIAGLFPLRGAIRAREFEDGIIDLGRYQGVGAGDRFLVLRKIGLRTDGMGFTYEEADVLGQFIVTEVDENVSRGTVEPASFFDRINPGDTVIPFPDPPPDG